MLGPGFACKSGRCGPGSDGGRSLRLPMEGTLEGGQVVGQSVDRGADLLQSQMGFRMNFQQRFLDVVDYLGQHNGYTPLHHEGKPARRSEKSSSLLGTRINSQRTKLRGAQNTIIC